MPTLRLSAPAKVNLALEVLGRRDDGYHEVRTILQAVGLCDELTLEPADDLSLHVAPPGSAPVAGNLVLRAAKRLQTLFDVRSGASIMLRKRIPMSAGLGGGSSDAAAALVGLSRLWGLGASLDRLTVVAAELGSDVPFFLRGGTALGEGRGERLSGLPKPAEGYAAIMVVPDEQDDGGKTKRLYGLLETRHFSDGTRTMEVMARLHTGEPVSPLMFNAFEAVAEQAFAAYSTAREVFAAAVGAGQVLLSGAGPSLFTLAETEDQSVAVTKRLRASGYTAFSAPLLSSWQEGGYWSSEKSTAGEDHGPR